MVTRKLLYFIFFKKETNELALIRLLIVSG